MNLDDRFIEEAVERIDKRLLTNRLAKEGNVCGCLLKDLTLYDDCGLVNSDFVTKHGRLLFNLVKKFRERGFHECDELTYKTNIEDIDKNIGSIIENDFGGWQQIQNLINIAPTKNWDAFLDDMNKSNTVIALYKKGFNIFDEITLDNGKKIVPLDYFEKLTSSEIIDFYEGTLASIGTKINASEIVEEGYITFDDAFLKKVESKEETGILFDKAGVDIEGNDIWTFPYMSNNLLGLKYGTMTAFAAQSGCGKTSYMITLIMSLITKGEKISFVTNESRKDEITVLFFIWVLYRIIKYPKLSKRKFLSGDLTDEDRIYLKKAQKLWEEKYSRSVMIHCLSDANASLSAEIIKKDVLRYGATVFIVDTMKLTLSDTGDEGSWLPLIKDSRALTKVALKNNVIGIMTLQLAPSTESRLWLDVSCLANCKQIKEVLSNLILFRKIKPDELDPESKIYIKPFRTKRREDGTYYKEPYEPNKEVPYVIMFVDKSRRGTDSAMTGEAFLCRTDLDHVGFYETAKCYPSRKMVELQGR